MVECNWIDEKEFQKVASEATMRAIYQAKKDNAPERLMCIYNIHSFYDGGCDCADEGEI